MYTIPIQKLSEDREPRVASKTKKGKPRRSRYIGRIFTDKQIARWLKEDELPPEQAEKMEQLMNEAFPGMP